MFNSDLNVTLFLVNDQDGVRSFVGVRFESRDEQSHQLGRDIYLQCAVQGNVERPHEYQYTKDGEPLKNSTINEHDSIGPRSNVLFDFIDVEVHPNGALIIRNAQASDAGQYRYVSIRVSIVSIFSS